MVIGVVGAGCLAFIIAYRFYGRMLTRLFGLGGAVFVFGHSTRSRIILGRRGV